MKTRIQISVSLFYQMALYIMEHEDASDPRYKNILFGIDQKMEAVKRHNLYTMYKTAQTPE